MLGTSVSSASLSRMYTALWQEVGHTIALTKEGGGQFDWDIVSFPKLLKHMVAESCAFCSLLRQLYQRSPCTASSPYHLVVYGDEAVPGNVLRLDNKRKMSCLYFAIQELGPDYLKHECLWMPIAVLRSSVSKQVSGGISACLKSLFRHLFLQCRIAEDGIVVDLGIPETRHARLFFALGSLVADGDALRAIFLAKGAAGNLPCLACKNVLTRRVDSEYLVHISEPDTRRFDLASNEDIWEKVDRLAEAKEGLTRASFDDLQMAYGLNYSADGLLEDRELRPYFKPRDALTYDAMHILLSNGMVQTELGLVFTAFKAAGVQWDALRRYADAGWQTCSVFGGSGKMRGAFSPAREAAHSSDEAFKATASEALLCLPVVVHFALAVVRPLHIVDDVKIQSLAALGVLVSLVLKGKRGASAGSDVAHAAREHGRIFNAAYPDGVKPKHHWVHHLPHQLDRDAFIIDAFVGERKNGVVKSLAAEVHYTGRFERSVLARTVAANGEALKRPGAFCNQLLAATDGADVLGVADSSIARSMQWNGTRINKGDIVFVDDGRPVQITACVLLPEGFYLIVATYVKVGEVTRFHRYLGIASCVCGARARVGEGEGWGEGEGEDGGEGGGEAGCEKKRRGRKRRLSRIRRL